MIDFLEQAFVYTGLGFKIFPLRENSKVAFTKRGVYDASDDENVIAEWAKKTPRANIAVGCGAASGICVVDVDKHHGGIETFMSLCERNGEVPKCPKALTPQGGYHLYFAHNPKVGNSVGSKTTGLGPGIDVKSHGGYVVLPPSVWDGFKNGEKVANGGVYSWIRAPLGSVMPPLPEWMLNKLIPKKKAGVRPKQWDRSNASLVRADEILKYVDNQDYQTWISVGMALKSEFGDAGFNLWDAWSANGFSQHNSRECKAKWRSFKNIRSITMGTIMHHAKASGAPINKILKG